jgi:hypothetical protein
VSWYSKGQSTWNCSRFVLDHFENRFWKPCALPSSTEMGKYRFGSAADENVVFTYDVSNVTH